MDEGIIEIRALAFQIPSPQPLSRGERDFRDTLLRGEFWTRGVKKASAFQTPHPDPSSGGRRALATLRGVGLLRQPPEAGGSGSQGKNARRTLPEWSTVEALRRESVVAVSDLGNSFDMMDINKVLRLLPHRYPFLLIDRVLEFEKDKRLLALKNVTYNEPYFNGHFPIRPVMPGVLIVEAMAQATGLLAMESNPETVSETSIYLFVGIDKARFKRPVEPGDQLLIEVQQKAFKRGIGIFSGKATVDGGIAATADIMCTAREFDV